MKSAEREVDNIIRKIEKEKDRKEVLKQRIASVQDELTEIARECDSLGFDLRVEFYDRNYRDFATCELIECGKVAIVEATKVTTVMESL